jgi:hypothetical protein
VILRKCDSGTTDLDAGSIAQRQRAKQSSWTSGLRSRGWRIANQVSYNLTAGELTHAIEP